MERDYNPHAMKKLTTEARSFIDAGPLKAVRPDWVKLK